MEIHLLEVIYYPNLKMMYRIEYKKDNAEDFYNQYKKDIKDVISKYIQQLDKSHSDYNDVKLFLENLICDKKSHLKQLITVKPSDFSRVIRIMNKIINAKKDIDKFRKILNEIFAKRIYDGVKEVADKSPNKTRREKIFNKTQFISNLELRVCPYCGRNYIFTAKKNKDSTVKHHIDHFLPKEESKYPYLAFSYYNLIPCCVICNMSTCKHTKDPMDLGVTSPYEWDNSTKVFKLRLDSIDVFHDFLKVDEKYIGIDYDKNFNIDGYQKMFALKSLYAGHNDLVHDLLICKQFWAQDSVKAYYNNLIGENNNIGSRFILAFMGHYTNPEDHAKRPFSKLLKDISDHYDDLLKRGKMQ